MILLVETNFVLELAYLQDGHEHCEAILELARDRAGELELAIPAFSMGEAYYSQISQEAGRSTLQRRIIEALDDLSRTRAYAERSRELRGVTSFLEESNREDRVRLESVLKTLLSVATIIPTTGVVVAEAFDLQRSRGLSPPDALVYASVLSHLRSSPSSRGAGAASSRGIATSPTTTCGRILRCSDASFYSSLTQRSGMSEAGCRDSIRKSDTGTNRQASSSDRRHYKLRRVRTLDPDNLDRWISSWNRGLKESENLQMSRDILVNVVEAALGELEQAHNAYRRLSVPRGAASWRSEVLGLLELHFKRSTLTIELLRAEHGDKIVDDLGASLRKEGPYDLRQIYPLLMKVRGSPSMRVIEKGLLKELLG